MMIMIVFVDYFNFTVWSLDYPYFIQAVSVRDIIAEWDTDSDSETKLCNSQVKDSTVVAAVDFQLKDQSMSGKDKDNNYEQNATDASNIGNESDNDVVDGTPDRCQVS